MSSPEVGEYPEYVIAKPTHEDKLQYLVTVKDIDNPNGLEYWHNPKTGAREFRPCSDSCYCSKKDKEASA